MTKKETGQPAADDARAFRDAMKDARKLPGPERIRVVAGPVSPGAKHKRGAPQGPTKDLSEAASAFIIEERGEEWMVRGNGIDRAFLRKLGTGKVPVEARLDLHGQTRRDAVRALERFVATAISAGARSLMVVHGRGLHSGDEGPTLRTVVRAFLTEGPQAARVLACTSAPPALGGAGATLIWLRRSG